VLISWAGKSGNRSVPNIDALRKHLLREGRLEKKELVELIKGASTIMRKEPNVLRMKEPVIIVGDIHG
jgi:serine/threonine-protein phosphatase 2B catalytic subunit